MDTRAEDTLFPVDFKACPAGRKLHFGQLTLAGL